jgi:hypothetical protein
MLEDRHQEPPIGLRTNGSLPDDEAETSPENNLQNLFLECGVSPQQITELHQQLPHLVLSDRLIDHYFSAMFVSSILIWNCASDEFKQQLDTISNIGA